ncbi:MAG TPA: hypothetical protein VKR06_10825 [Ktedonosporobacter sp.]|nr:hypothetical protein [Ktedonosporobacter sp.]
MTHKARFFVSMFICLHAIVAVLHGMTHAGTNIWLTSIFSNAFVVVVIYIAPLVALSLLYTRWYQWGIWLLFLSMVGSLLFGLWYHFLLPGADNVASVSPGAWRLSFQISAFLLALIEALGSAVGVWLLYTARRIQVARQ